MLYVIFIIIVLKHKNTILVSPKTTLQPVILPTQPIVISGAVIAAIEASKQTTSDSEIADSTQPKHLWRPSK